VQHKNANPLFFVPSFDDDVTNQTDFEEEKEMIRDNRYQTNHNSEERANKNQALITNSKTELESEEEKFKEGLEKEELENVEKLKEELEEKSQELATCRTKNKVKRAKELESKVQDLQGLLSLYESIQERKRPPTNLIQEELERLEKELKEGLEKEELENVEELKEELEEKSQELATCRTKNKVKRAKELESKIQDLQELLSLYVNIQELQRPPINSIQKDLERKEKELKEGLEKEELESVEELNEELKKKSQELADSRAKNREKRAKELESKVQDLQELQSIAQNIQKIKQSHFQSPILEESPNQNQQFDQSGSIPVDTKISSVDLELKFGSDIEKSHIKKLNEMKNLRDDFSLYPDCAEKSLLKLKFFSLSKSLEIEDLAKVDLDCPTDQDIQRELELLKERIKIEDLFVQQEINRIEVNVNSNAWKEAELEINLVLKKIRSLNLQELFRLIGYGKSAATLIDGKDVILFLGKTGAGKSTTIHCLAGSTMEVKTVNGVDYIAPTKMRTNHLERVKTSLSSSKSETRYITAIPIDLKELGSISRRQVVLCDTPGFGDTAGPEVDIANALSIVGAIQKSKSVKPVILVSYLGLGDKFEGLKSLAHILAGMIPNIEVHMESVSFLFTKYPEEKQKSIFASLLSVRDELTAEEMSDKGFESLFTVMLRKAKAKVWAVNPLDKAQAIMILDDLAVSGSIQRPDEEFQFSLNEASRAALKEQGRRHQITIMNALKRFAYDLVGFKLNELKKLLKLLGEDCVEKVYAECTQSVSKHLNEQYNLATDSINRCLKEENGLDQDQVEQYNLDMAHAKFADFIRKEHLETDVVDSNAYIQNLKDLLSSLLRSAKEKKIDDHSLKKTLDKIRLLTNVYGEMKHYYDDANEILERSFQICEKSLKNYLENENFEKCGLGLTVLLNSINLFQDHWDKDDKLGRYGELKNKLKQQVRNSTKSYYPLFTQSELTDKDIENLKTWIFKLESLKNDYNLRSHIPLEEFETIYTEIIDKLENYFSSINTKIQKLFKEKGEDSFGGIEGFFKEMEKLRRIPAIEIKTSNAYHGTLETICGFVQELRRNVSHELNLIFQRATNINCEKLCDYIQGLEASKWVTLYKPNLHSSMMKDVEKNLIKYCRSSLQKLKDTPLGMEDCQSLIEAYNLVEPIEKMKSFEELFQNLSSTTKELKNIYYDKVKKNFHIIKQFLEKCESRNSQPESLNLAKIEKIFEYLDACKKVKTLRGEALEVFDNFKNFLRNRRTYVDNRMRELFGDIIDFKQETYAPSESSPNNERSMIYDEGLDLKIDEKASPDEKNISESIMINLEEIKLVNQNDEVKLKKKEKKLFLDKNIEGLDVLFQELYDMETHFPKVLETFDPEKELFKEWKRKLEENADLMSDNMEEFLNAHESKDLQDQIQIAKVLSRLDHYLTRKYYNIYKQYQSQFYKEVPNSYEAALKDVATHNYKNLAWVITQWEDLDSAAYKKNLTKIHYDLNTSLETLIEQTKIQARFTATGGTATPEKIRVIVKNLNLIKMAGDYVQNLLDPKVLTDLKECENNVKAKVEEGLIQLLQSIKGCISKSRFYEVNKQKQVLSIICDDLGSFCAERVLNEFKALDELEASHLNKLQDLYKTLELKDYANQQPKDIFDKFDKFEAEFSLQKYSEVQENIKDCILQNFRSNLVAAKESECFDFPNNQLRNVEYAFSFLPTSLQDILKIQIDRCKEEIQRAKLDHEEGCKMILQKETDLQVVSTFLEKCKNAQQFSSVKQIREHVFEEVGRLKSEIVEKFDSQQMEEAFPKIKVLSEYKAHLSGHFSSLSSYWTELMKYLEVKFNDIFSSFISQFKIIEAIFPQDSTIIKGAWNALLDFNDLFRKCQTQNIKLTDSFPQAFNEKFIEINNILIKYFKEHNNQYEAIMKELDIEALNKILKSAKTWEPIIKSIQQYSLKGSEIDDSFCQLTTASSQVETYANMKKSILERIEKTKNELDTEQLINEKTKGFNQSREEFYEMLNMKLEFLLKIRSVESLEIDIEGKINVTLQILQGKIQEVYKLAAKSVQSIFEKGSPSRENCDNLHISCSNLITFGKYMKMSIKQSNVAFENVETLFFAEFSKWIPALLKTPTALENNATLLINMKILSMNLELFRVKIDEKINETLETYKRQFGNAALTHLGQRLNQDKTGTGQHILEDYTCFQGFTLSLFNTKTKSHGIDYVLKCLGGNEIEKGKILKRYTEFEEIYKGLVKSYLKPEPDLSEIIANTRLLVCHDVGELSANNSLGFDVVVKLPKLLAHIFAIWTLQHPEHFYAAKGLGDQETYLLQPHAAQVISIFRLLGVGDKKEVMQNNLIEISTGEGKSVILAATASVLALLGFEVSCACYSQYLSERDHRAFRDLFDALSVSQEIHYGTFNKLCEDALNENGDIRQKVRDIVSQASSKKVQQVQKPKRRRILLIDEVDVFFSKDFYGGLYTPCTFLKDPTIGALTDWIWKSWRSSAINLNLIKKTAEYQNCLNRFGHWKVLIKEAVKNMLFDLKEYESHDYVVKDNKIGYKEHEKISFGIFYRYKTLFAYYAEHERGRISQESLNENKNILLYCGHFSYSEIPKQFNFIMGVTGTLKTLNPAQRNIIEKVYRITKNTFVPSVFRKNNFDFKPKDHIRIENENDYHVTILKEIKAKLAGESGKRAVLVFFESAKRLKECLESNVLREMKDNIDYLTEEADLQERQTRIKRATSSGQITFLTRTFGRGTDFICHDQVVEANGGVHVIQTFVSEDIAEEVQIKGRTARQDNSGSYSMVLLEPSLEEFLIRSEDIENVHNNISLPARVFGALGVGKKHYNNLYELIDDRRKQRFESQYAQNQDSVDSASQYHAEGLKFLKALDSGNFEEIKDFLLSENKGASEVHKSRTLILMDATGSMIQLLHNAKNTVQTMFERTCTILKEYRITEDSFLIQFAVYRNYNCEEGQLLEFSPWETKPDSLRKFMEKIRATGGLGNEAIEIGLWHANCENERDSISQIIIIGDAPANTEQEVNSKRARLGEKYWKSTKFAKKTFYSTELQQLKMNNVPVHAFYVAKAARRNFEEIAGFTGGNSKFLDINSEHGAAMLTDFVVQAVLHQVGQENGGNGDALAQAYRNKFIKSYNS